MGAYPGGEQKKLFAFLSKKSSGTREQRIPDNMLARVTQSFQRRLDDDLEAVFNRACISNDDEAATDLFALMEKWQNGARQAMAVSIESTTRLSYALVAHWSGSWCCMVLRASAWRRSSLKHPAPSRMTEMSESTDFIPSNNLMLNLPPQHVRRDSATFDFCGGPLMASNN